MNESKLTKSQFISIGVMLFGLFFGAGNLIFPPFLAKEAGEKILWALVGFILSGVVLSILGVAAVAKAGDMIQLSERVSKPFSRFFVLTSLLMIGPGVAIPRAGSTPYEMVVAPYLQQDGDNFLPQLIYTVIFFIVAYLLSRKPGKIVQRIGRITAPSLIALITILVIGVVRTRHNIDPTVLPPYDAGAFTGGIIAGYNTLDVIASLAFGLVVALSLKQYGVSKEALPKVTIQIGALAGSILAIIYSALAYVGYMMSGYVVEATNGAQILYIAATSAFGKLGAVMLALIFTVACLNTCVGLLTSLSEYFHKLFPRWSYQQILLLLVITSAILANFGLDSILTYSIPLLVFIYPVAITLVFLELLRNQMNFTQRFTQLTVYMVLAISFFSILYSTFNVNTPFLTYLPLYNEGLGWVIPFVVAVLVYKVKTLIFLNTDTFEL